MWVGPKCNHRCPDDREAEGALARTSGGESHVKMEQRDLKKLALKTGVMRPQARECSSHQKLEEVRKSSPPEPLEGARPCCHLDFDSMIIDF